MTAPPVLRSAWRRAQGLAAKVFPDHWSFLLGELALYSFATLVATGVILAFWFDASGRPVVYDGGYGPLRGVEMSAAYASVLDISFERHAGLLVRQTHHWAALVFTGAVAAHATRLVLTGAFRRPRRLNFTIGVVMLVLVLMTGFFGLGLPDELLSGTGNRVGYTFPLSIPVVGPAVAFLVYGGEFGHEGMITRLFWLHVVVFPVLIGGLLAAHLALVLRQTHTQMPEADRDGDREVRGDRAWPAYLLKTSAVAALVVGTLLGLGGLVQINPVWLYGPYDPSIATVPAQPAIYLQWVEGALRIVPPVRVSLLGAEITQPFLVGIVFPLALLGSLVATPHLHERITGDRGEHHELQRPRDVPARTAAVAAVLALLGVLVAAASHDVQARALRIELSTITNAYRFAALLVPALVAAVTVRVCRDRRERDEATVATAGPARDREREPVA